MSPEETLREMGLTLPPVFAPAGIYTGAVRVGDLLFLSGHVPVKDGQVMYVGKVGKDLTQEQAVDAARHVALSCLATIKAALGDLDRVERVVKVTGFVNCTEDFTGQTPVMNGCSELLVALFGEKGRHARAAVGMQQLPMGVAVEIEMVVQVRA